MRIFQRSRLSALSLVADNMCFTAFRWSTDSIGKETKLGWTCDLVLFHKISCQGQKSELWKQRLMSRQEFSKSPISPSIRPCMSVWSGRLWRFLARIVNNAGYCCEVKTDPCICCQLQVQYLREQFSWSHKQWWWNHRDSREWMKSFVDALSCESFLAAAVLLVAYFMG